MGIVRDIGFTLPAAQESVMVTCAALYTTAGSTGASLPFNSTGTAGVDVVVSTGTPIVIGGTSTVFGLLYGRVIDRLAAPFGAGFYGACPAAYLRTSRGTTEADRALQIGVKLQHGDSSGGGDMADFSTERQPAIRNYFSTARTTDQLSWEVSGRSTGGVNAVSNWCYYNLDAAKRFIRAVGLFGKTRVTTESSGDEQARVGMNIAFIGGDLLSGSVFSAGQPSFGGQGFVYALERNSPESSSTSTA